MRFSPAIAARLATLVLVSACAGLYAAAGAVAKPDPAAPYLGMSVTDILACAGEPHSRFESGPNKETLVFRYTGTGPVPAEKAKTDDKTSGGKKSADKKSDAKKSADKTSDDKKSDDKKSDDAKSAGKPSDDKKSDDRSPTLTSSPPSSAKTARRRRTRTGPARRASCSKTASWSG